MCTNLSNKREVREHVKVSLESFLEDGTIDTEELKLLVKSIADTIALPTTSVSVQRETLGKLLKTLEEQSAGPDVINRVLSRLPSSPEKQKTDVSLTNGVKEDSSNIAPTPASIRNSTSTVSISASLPRTSLFDLNALKERMSRKREELQQKQRSIIKLPLAESTDADAGPRQAALPHNVDHVQKSSTEEKYTGASKATSVQASEHTTQTLLPDRNGLVDFASRSEVVSQPPLKETAIDPKVKINAEVTLTAAPVEEDLYAGLVVAHHHRVDFESRRGGGRGWRGRSTCRGGTQRSSPYDEAFHPFYSPPEGYTPQRFSKGWQGYSSYDCGNYSHPY